MKYRVNFECYWYNTGAADNHHYINCEDFNTFDEAITFRDRIQEQYEMSKKYEYRKISFDEYSNWKKSFEIYEVENGFISGLPTIVKYFPAREEPL